MIPISTIRENPEKVINRLTIKNIDAKSAILQIIALDDVRKETQRNMDDLLAQTNNLAKEIGILFKSGKKEEADALKQKNTDLKEQAKALEQKLEETQTKLQSVLVQLPNLPHESVPSGKSAADNIIVKQAGEMPVLQPDAMPHWDIATKFDLISFDMGSKVTGAGFPFYKGQGARLQRALINFFLDEAIAAGYHEIQPPLLINEDSGYGTGQLPDKEGQMYHIGIDNLYLIPTAEVPVTNLYRNLILQKSDLPIKNVAYSNCFRREAGSYGKDVRGLNRLHQFDKVEIVQIANPSDSYAILDTMIEHVAGLLAKLELPYRILRLCGGDMSFTSALTFDFEVWSAAQERWLEVSSVSNFENFQANRMKLRFKDDSGKTQLAHTLNGSALALPRIVAALLENNQQGDQVRIPHALRAYTGYDYISLPKV
ncbi:MAG TPA: serine--tRNA ligase [Bacteroidales bacterium]|nr:MAG: serine--tRNA ligase [Bacteroidetes bacterium GWE2_42_24]OFY25990.1 MAG: serine--tRNA ligase [Bacteroidetes bacterium GWF2_43_11]HBZ66598.1 serine--tRNA ligase [Bacteroidales bacterium]